MGLDLKLLCNLFLVGCGDGLMLSCQCSEGNVDCVLVVRGILHLLADALECMKMRGLP